MNDVFYKPDEFAKLSKEDTKLVHFTVLTFWGIFVRKNTQLFVSKLSSVKFCFGRLYIFRERWAVCQF